MWCDVLSVTVGLVDIVVVAAIGVCFVYMKVAPTSTEATKGTAPAAVGIKAETENKNEETESEVAEEHIGIEMGVYNTLTPKKKTKMKKQAIKKVVAKNLLTATEGEKKVVVLPKKKVVNAVDQGEGGRGGGRVEVVGADVSRGAAFFEVELKHGETWFLRHRRKIDRCSRHGYHVALVCWEAMTVHWVTIHLVAHRRRRRSQKNLWQATVMHAVVACLQWPCLPSLPQRLIPTMYQTFS